MAGRRVLHGGDSNMNSVLRRVPCSSSETLDSLFLSGSSSSFLGSRTMVTFEAINGGNRSDRSFFCSFDQEDIRDEDFDEYFHQPEKKQRIAADKVHFLERSFEEENKLDPERKIQLAKELGLQPRQIAIWFQNRRARWKTRQLEKNYQALQASYNSLKSDYENVLKEKENLKAEVLHLADELQLKEKKADTEFSNTNNPFQGPPRKPITESVSLCERSKDFTDLGSIKSMVLDSDSPHYTDGSHSSFLERGDSSYVFEAEQSDLSQDDEDNLRMSLLPPPANIFPKIEDGDYFDLPANSCYIEFPAEDHAFGFWSY